MYRSPRRSSKKKSQANALRRGQRRRIIETLEDRRLLTTYNVTTFADRFIDPAVTAVSPFGADGKLTLREAIFLSNTHLGYDTINLQKGTYAIQIGGIGEDHDRTGDFDVTDNLTIKGNAKGGTVVDGASMDRVFNIPKGDPAGISLAFYDLTITRGTALIGGTSNGGGGGVAGETDADRLTFINTTVTNNSAVSTGGGIYNRGGFTNSGTGDVTLTNSHVDNNHAASGTTGYGGGIFLDTHNTLNIKAKSTVNLNTAYLSGGGIRDTSSDQVNVSDSQISGNVATNGGPLPFDGLGGGAFLFSQTINVTDSIISYNSANSDGGGFYAVSRTAPGVITIIKSTFDHNKAQPTAAAVASIRRARELTCSRTARLATTAPRKAVASTAREWYL